MQASENVLTQYENNESAADLQQQHPDLPSLGNEFRELRESRGLSIEQVAVDLYIDRRFVKAIEEDNFNQIGKRVFVRGYVKNYARYLNMDQKLVLEMLEPFLQRVGHISQAPRLHGTNMDNAEQLDYSKSYLNMGTRSWRSRYRTFTFVLGIVLLLVLTLGGGAAYMYFTEVDSASNLLVLPAPPTQQSETSLATRELPSPLPEPVFVEPVSTTTVAEPEAEDIVQAEDLLPLELTSQTTEDQVPLPSAAADDSPDAAQQITADIAQDNPDALVVEGTDRLKFLLEEKCWIEVRRPDGSVVISRLFQPGDNPLLLLILPVDVIIGNAAGAAVRVNAHALNIDSYINSNVARLRIPG